MFEIVYYACYLEYVMKMINGNKTATARIQGEPGQAISLVAEKKIKHPDPTYII